MSLIEEYQERCGLVDYDLNDASAIYSSSGFYSGNDYVKHGLRDYLYEQFSRYKIGDLFNLNIKEFLDQDFDEISLQLDIAREQAKRDQAEVNRINAETKTLEKGLNNKGG